MNMLEIQRYDWGLGSDPELRRLYDQERLILDATNILHRLLRRKGINKAQLAKLLGRSPAYVTQALNGNRNLTLRTLADFASVMGYTISLSEARRVATFRQEASGSSGSSGFGPYPAKRGFTTFHANFVNSDLKESDDYRGAAHDQKAACGA